MEMTVLRMMEIWCRLFWCTLCFMDTSELEIHAIDRFALKRGKDMTPGARLDWLAAAREFSMMVGKVRKGTEKKVKNKGKGKN